MATAKVSRIIERICCPADLRPLSPTELQQLAREIREELVNTVTATGGHLASNLGVVELTLALHRVFDSPRDKLVWDVGHQSYVHKLLTGRRESFGTLRQHGGLSGFTDRMESPHDPFGAGHASTSISAALGMACARDLKGEDYHVVAIIGDGGLTGGMAFEALNQAGHLKKRLLVVLNDNGMAIAPSVGALARLFNRVRFDWRFLRAKRSARWMAYRLPLGRLLLHWAAWAKEGVKELLLPQALWRGFGFNYIGPLDGHNLATLEGVLRQVRDSYRGPTLVHVLTVKGKGYSPAERDAVAYHGLPAPWERRDGMPTFSQVFAATLLRLFQQEPRVVAITAAMPGGTGLSLVARRFPGRVFDVGISEQHAVTFAAGLASQGLIPIVAIYSTFLQRAFDQVAHDVCLQGLPVVFAVDRSGLVGEDGKTHHGSLDLSYLCAVPNLVVCAPRDESELPHLLYTAVRAGRPVAVRYPRGWGSGDALEAELREIALGKGELLREGKDVALVALGSMVAPALEAADQLSRRGIAAAVVNARFAKPLDAELIVRLAREVGRMVTVEENSVWGGFGAAVAQLLHSPGLSGVPVVNIALPDQFLEQGPQPFLRSRYGLDGEGITRRVLAAFPRLRLLHQEALSPDP